MFFFSALSIKFKWNILSTHSLCIILVMILTFRLSCLFSFFDLLVSVAPPERKNNKTERLQKDGIYLIADNSAIRFGKIIV